MNQSRPKAVKSNLSIGKAFQIMEALALARGPMRLQDISQKININTSTVLRFLKTLMDQDYVGQNHQTSQYYLTMKLCWLGEEIKARFRFRDVVRPYLESMAEDWKESTFLAVEQNGDVVYLDAVDGPDHVLRTLQRIGKMAPLNSTAVGKCILSGYDEKSLDNLIASKGLVALTHRTIVTKSSLIAELERVKNEGCAIDDEECELGMRCVAAPLLDYSGRIIAAISTSGPVNRMDMEKITRIKISIKTIAHRISVDLGYTV